MKIHTNASSSPDVRALPGDRTDRGRSRRLKASHLAVIVHLVALAEATGAWAQQPMPTHRAEAANVVRELRRIRVACRYGVSPEPRVPANVNLVLYNGDRTQVGMNRLSRLMHDSPLDVHVAQTLSLDQTAAAHRALAAHHVGKLVMRVHAQRPL